ARGVARGRHPSLGVRARYAELRLAALRRGEHQIDSAIPEDEVRGREFLEPETGLASRVTESIVRREHHQDLHDRLGSCANGRAGTTVFSRSTVGAEPVPRSPLEDTTGAPSSTAVRGRSKRSPSPALTMVLRTCAPPRRGLRMPAPLP